MLYSYMNGPLMYFVSGFPMVGGLLAITLIYWVYYCLKRCWSCGWDDKKKQKRILNNNQDNYGTLKVDDDTFTMSNFSNFYVRH